MLVAWTAPGSNTGATKINALRAGIAQPAFGGRHDLVGYQHLRGFVYWRAAILRDGSFKEGGSESAPRHARPYTF